jgi:ketosteroid isomerase-like protein
VPSQRLVIATIATLLCAIGTACSSASTAMTTLQLTSDSVVRFLNTFEELAEKENFDLVQELVHEDAVFRFNDGDFVGRAAIRAAFEKTWKGTPNVKKALFYLTDIQVLSVDKASASATYTYNWEGTMDGKAFSIQGRGTRVLVVEGGRVQIIHEHLSRFPR